MRLCEFTNEFTGRVSINVDRVLWFFPSLPETPDDEPTGTTIVLTEGVEFSVTQRYENVRTMLKAAAE